MPPPTNAPASPPRVVEFVRAEKLLANQVRLVKEFEMDTNYLLNARFRVENGSAQALALPSLDWSIGAAGPESPQDKGDLVGFAWHDGKSAKQLKATSIVLALPPLKTFTVAVAAVDTQGVLSAMSNAVTIKAGHAAPSRPTGLSGQATSSSQVALQWQASTASGGARVAYRVLRNGKTVGQTGGTSITLGNLASSTSYSFTVMAVDSVGYASPPSDPVTVATQAPPASAGVAHVFLLASTDASFVDFQQHYQEIGTVYPTYYDCLSNGTFIGKDDPLITGWAEARGVKVEARWNCQNTSTLHNLLSNVAARTALEQQMTNAAVTSKWDGINLDFEAGAAGDRYLMTAFVTELAAALHGQSKSLSVDVSAKVKDVPNHPRSTFFDYDALAAQADTIFVMAWGIHWRTSTPGAIDDWSWASQVANYVAARPNAQKYVLGFGMYGFDWPAGGGPANPATPLQYQDVAAELQSTSAQLQWDSAAMAPFFSYTDGSGVHHDVWFTNAQSIGARIGLAHSKGVGIGLWRLGDEDPAIWNDPLLQPGAW